MCVWRKRGGRAPGEMNMRASRRPQNPGWPNHKRRKESLGTNGYLLWHQSIVWGAEITE